MSMQYIRSQYGVPAQRGGRVIYSGNGREQRGTIVGARGGHLKIRLDGARNSLPFHPTWCLVYATTDPQP